MTEHLRTPGLADQVVMLQDAAVCFEFGTRLKCENKMLVPQTNELGEITVLRDGRGRSE